MDCCGVWLFSGVLVGLVRRRFPARNHHSTAPGADGEVATLVKPARLHRMNRCDDGMVASERLAHLVRRVAVWVALASERVAR